MSNIIEFFPEHSTQFVVWKPKEQLTLPEGYRVVKGRDGYYSQRRCMGLLWFDPLHYFNHYHQDYETAVKVCWYEHEFRNRRSIR